MYNTPYQNQMNMQIPVQNNLALVKGYFRKKTVLAVGIFTAILAAVEFISMFFITPAANNFLNNGILNGQYSNIEDYLRILQDAMSSGNYSSAIFSLLVSGLLVAAFLIIYFKSKNPMPNANPRAGFTILQVFTIIQLVFICIAACFALFVIIIAFMMIAFGSASSTTGNGFRYNFGSDYYASTDATLAVGVMVIVVLVFAVVFALLLMWSISAVRLVGSVKKTIDSPQVTVKGAKLFGVLNIVLGVLSCFGAFSSLFAIFGVNTQGVFSAPASSAFSAFAFLSFVSAACSSVYILLLGTLSLGYDKYIKNHLQSVQPPMAPTFRPVSGAPVPPPAGNPYQQQPLNPYTQAQRPVSPFPPAPPVTPEGIKEEPRAEEPADNPPEPAPAEPADAEAPVVSKAACPGCGHPVRGEDIFCERCGYKLK